MKDKINPEHYTTNGIEFIDLIQNGVDDFGSYCQGNILKYSYRANKKHDTPNTDIEKTIRYCEFWLNHLEGKKASDPRKKESLATFDKLNELLSDQEIDFLKDKKIVHIRVGTDNLKIDEEDAKNVINLLGRAIYED
jgi:hypothetical protein|nr:MAG TPA: nucelotide kinase [Caudoviricetes sp.]